MQIKHLISFYVVFAASVCVLEASVLVLAVLAMVAVAAQER
jgi:hypothetical protein